LNRHWAKWLVEIESGLLLSLEVPECLKNMSVNVSESPRHIFSCLLVGCSLIVGLVEMAEARTAEAAGACMARAF